MGHVAFILCVNELSYTMVKLEGYSHDFHENISLKINFILKILARPEWLSG